MQKASNNLPWTSEHGSVFLAQVIKIERKDMVCTGLDMEFVEDFYSTLQAYNEAVLPITIITYLLGIFAIYLALKKSNNSSKMISAVLSFLWIWSGVVFFIIFFGPMEAEFLSQTMSGIWYLGGVLFIVQGILFLIFEVARDSPSFKMASDGNSVFGVILITYAMIIYPIIGFLTGFSYPRYPVFGTGPCPLTIFTLGFLQWADRKMPIVIAIIPFIWSLMGIMPILELNVWADVGEMLSGIIGFPLILYHSSKLSKSKKRAKLKVSTK